MIYFYLTLLIFVSTNIDSHELQNDFQIETQNGNLLFKCDENYMCIISLNEQIIENEFLVYGDIKDSVIVLKHENSVINLIRTHHGDSCPSMYFLIDICPDQSTIKTQVFGNCNELEPIEFKEGRIQFNFASEDVENRFPESYQYLLQTRELNQISE